MTRRSDAWIERTIESCTTIVEVAPDGSAKVHYELRLSVRGERLRSMTLEGIDPDAEPLPDGTIARVRAGRARSLPLPLSLVASDGKLQLSVPNGRSLSGSDFLLQFGYRTNLLESGALQHHGEWSRLAWQGPQLDSGIDSATVIVRAPSSQRPPRVAPSSEADGFGIVMNTLRRSERTDELELVRAYLARGERMTWQVQLDARIFEDGPTGAAARGGTAEVRPRSKASDSRLPSAPPRDELLWSLLAGFGYALLVLVKSRAMRTAARQPTCRPLVLAPAWVRASLAGACVFGAAAAVLWGNQPAVGAALLIASMLLATHRSGELREELRGPGRWRPLEPDEIEDQRRGAPPGAWLDAGSPLGLALLTAALGGAAYGATRLFPTSPYLGASALCAGAALLPLFCTGRPDEASRGRVESARRILLELSRACADKSEYATRLIGRATRDEAQLDELRIVILPKRPIAGLIALEIAVERHETLAGNLPAPVLLVRAAEGGACRRALPRTVAWTRGRTSTERAALLRPRLPTVTLTLALIDQVLDRASRPLAVHAPGLQRSKNSFKSRDKGHSTQKPGTSSVPAHAT